MNNPYTSRAALQDASLFTGREHELRELGAFINGNQSVSIVGPRKIGKTSLIIHLMRKETLAALALERENLFVYIDCQMLSGSQHNQVFAQFCTQMGTALRARGFGPELALKTAISTPSRTAFEAALRKLNHRGLRVVLLLDEFEQLTVNPNIDVNFFNALRSAAGRLRLVFLTASASPLIELTYSERSQKILSSPFFNIFAPLFIGLLSEAEARSLIRSPMETVGNPISSQMEGFIYELAGGHPLALQIACYHAWENPDDPKQIELQTKLELEAHFQYYWHNLSAIEREVLRHPTEANSRELGNAALRVIFRNLIRKSLLVQMEASYAYPSKAWEEFVLAQPDESSTLPSVDLPVQGMVAQERGASAMIDTEERIALTNDSKTNEFSLHRVMRESLPELIGGLIVAIILAFAEPLSKRYPLFEKIKTNTDQVDPIWLILILGFLIAGFVILRMVLKQKKDKTVRKQIGEKT